ncbi:hypothetical protein RB195_025726 [Necator americanus]|uniref:Uncharacterized protein n=1 Tax=Necator americanus TaxID=51031 RepID=A0ABR1ETL3_NECAM
MRTNRTQDGHSSIVHDLVGNVNVSLEDSGLHVQGVRGQRAGIEAITWLSDRQKSMHIVASTLPNGVTLTKEEILIRCPNESTMLRMLPSGVDVSVEQLNKLQIDRGGGELSLGSSVITADVVKVTAMGTDLNLDNSGRVTAHTMNSRISVQTPVQNVGMTAAHHVMRIDGGAPRLIVESGRSCIEVVRSHGLPQLKDLLSPFVTPPDIFANVGPGEVHLTTLPQDFVEPSFPRPGPLGGPVIFFNGTDRCAPCLNQTSVLPRTILPTSLIPTFPTRSPIEAVPSSTGIKTFPTLLTHPSEASTFPMALTTQPHVSIVTASTPRKTLPPSSTEPFPSPAEITTVTQATLSTSIIKTEGLPANITTTPTIGPTRTSDQFVIGQFEDFTGVATGRLVAVTLSPSRPTITAHTSGKTSPTPISVPGATAPPTSTPIVGSSPSPTSLPVIGPGQVTAPISGGGGGGSWETETLFPTPPTTLPRKPSVLVLKMKIPSSLDLQSFDLTSNLTSALSQVVKESVKRVKRFKRATDEKNQEYLVQVHKIERVGSAVQVLFSVNETEVDSYMVEKDLSSLDRSYLMRYVGFPVGFGSVKGTTSLLTST